MVNTFPFLTQHISVSFLKQTITAVNLSTDNTKNFCENCNKWCTVFYNYHLLNLWMNELLGKPN